MYIYGSRRNLFQTLGITHGQAWKGRSVVNSVFYLEGTTCRVNNGTDLCFNNQEKFLQTNIVFNMHALRGWYSEQLWIFHENCYENCSCRFYYRYTFARRIFENLWAYFTLATNNVTNQSVISGESSMCILRKKLLVVFIVLLAIQGLPSLHSKLIAISTQVSKIHHRLCALCINLCTHTAPITI